MKLCYSLILFLFVRSAVGIGITRRLRRLDETQTDTPSFPISKPGECLSIANLICSTGGFETLCSMIEQFGLKDKLSDGSWTIFAPTNDAFTFTNMVLSDKMKGMTFDDLSESDTEKILLYHLVEGEARMSDNLECKGLTKMANGITSRTKCAGGAKYQKGTGNDIISTYPMLAAGMSDISACNGSLIHVLTAIMIPGGIIDEGDSRDSHDNSSHDDPDEDEIEDKTGDDGADHDNHDHELPTAINQIVSTAETYIYCTSESGCDDPADYATACDIKEAEEFSIVHGYLTSASGQYGKSYGDDGFFVDDGTGGIFVTTSDSNDVGELKVGTYVKVKGGTTMCLYGTLALNGGTVEAMPDEKSSSMHVTPPIIVFSPKQIGQFEKPPFIPNFSGKVVNSCNCLDPESYTGGRLITVRGSMIGNLFDDGEWGWKVFLDDGSNGIGQVFIDGASDSYVQEIADTLLVEGTDLCVTGNVAQFAGVGWEILPRTKDDIQRC